MFKLKCEKDFYVFSCPNCFDFIIVNKNELNCRIFRHGVYKNSYKQIDPHLSKELCNKLIVNNEVIGCTKPFEIINDINGDLVAVICDYK